MQTAPDLSTRWPALDVAGRRARIQDSLRLDGGPLADAFRASTAAAERAAGGLWQRDVSVWSSDAAVQGKIANRLGWMASPMLMADSLERLTAFAASVRQSGITDVVLLGMGGSSLAPEVLRAVLGVAPGSPRFHMLDSTDPAAVRAVDTPPSTTLYLLASKSGGTIEPNVLAAHFRRRLEQAGIARWADHFVAITDDGTDLARRARAESFRDVFINPSDIGGRYSALSFFGMVPAALMGIDIGALVGWGLAMLAATEPGFGDAMSNPATALGIAMGAGAAAGRDKLTLVVPPALEPFGLWVEQLIAESTGKNGTGIVPIAGEPAAEPDVYGRDRLFVRLRAPFAGALPPAAGTLGATRAPIVDLDWPEPAALGAEFVRWEFATAVAGALIHINPFDEPNVQQAKDATKAILAQYQSKGSLAPTGPGAKAVGGIALTASSAAERYLEGKGPEALLTLLRDGDYFVLLAYLGFDPAIAGALQKLRRAVRDRAHVATMFGYGPRYLHSTGQLHKGGPNTGVFLLITAPPREDVAIPDQPFSFGTLELAQALGDFQSLNATARRAVHAHLPAPDAAAIARLADVLLAR